MKKATIFFIKNYHKMEGKISRQRCLDPDPICPERFDLDPVYPERSLATDVRSLQELYQPRVRMRLSSGSSAIPLNGRFVAGRSRFKILHLG